MPTAKNSPAENASNNKMFPILVNEIQFVFSN